MRWALWSLVVLNVYVVGGALQRAAIMGGAAPGCDEEGVTVPPDWEAKLAAGNMLVSETLPDNSAYMATIGNGYLATFVSSDTTYVSGVYNGEATSAPSHRARIPGTSSISITNAVDPIYALDLECAVFLKRSTVQGASVEQRWYAPYNAPALLVHEIEVNASSEVTLFLNLNSGSTSDDIAFEDVVDPPTGTIFRQGYTKVSEETDSATTGVAIIYTVVPNSLSVGANSSTTFYFITAIRTTLDTNASMLLDTTVQIYNNAVANKDYLLNEHKSAWSKVWESGIEVAGDLELAQAINSSIYYILSRSLASNGYNGHVFWDCETWMFPTMCVFYPSIAKSLLQYRLDRVSGAEIKAKSYDEGWVGAMYPWESAFTGQETCPTWAGTGLREQHITGDVAFAAKQYWWMTGDTDWLSRAWTMIEEIADFWVGRVEPTGSGYSITDIIPPDEYADHVADSVYTNYVASEALNFATTVAKILGYTPNPYYTSVSEALNILFDEASQLHPEYDGYAGQTIKQADVVLLGFPLMMEMDDSVRLNDLIYYSDRTDSQGPAMTYSMHAIAWIELGDIANATQPFKQSYANIQPPFNVWSETPTGGTSNFITGAGGFLQGLWAGWGGVRMGDSGITFNPVLPPTLSYIKYRGLHYLDNSIDISFDSEQICFTLVTQGVPLYVDNTLLSAVPQCFGIKAQPLSLHT
ncbi:protein-glucosylgalactosylhydroxylysine glucosidase [Pelomyxa schiedti]|nr:protein-glucosylgalactosylhydroxylysine glucosidase [Pelomyxa schiedti]